MKTTLVLGGPGTGKTTRLIDIVKCALDDGVPPDRIAFVSFTRAAAYEARDRAVGEFKEMGLTKEDFPFFRTLHSLCFRMLGLNRGEIFSDRHRDELAALVRDSAAEEDPLMAITNRSRITGNGLKKEWDVSREDVSWFQLEWFARWYETFRQDRSVYDFTDLLERYVSSDVDGPCPVDIAVVDEAQDLSKLQWTVVEKLFADCRELYLAGDDDQSIYRWAGADEDRFLSLSVDETVVLPVSHRLSAPVFELADEVVHRIRKRYPKETRSSGKPGTVEWLRRVDDVDLSSGSWLLLVRARHQMEKLAKVARDQGVVYAVCGKPSVDVENVLTIRVYERLRRGESVALADAKRVLDAMGVKRKLVNDLDQNAEDLGISVKAIWHDALVKIPVEEREYYIACLRCGEKLDGLPRIHIDTIHGSKGREADNVLLVTEQTKRIAESFRHDEDAEHRVFYTGITRASRALYVLQTRKTRYEYRL